jgi:hypothetical protein
MRKFQSGATRNTEEGKYDYDGFLSPLAIERFGAYMHKHRHLPDGSMRASDNWQLGIPKEEYMKSMWRHFFEVWSIHRGLHKGDITESLSALMFNVQGYLHEQLKK